jgi:hypothetical protein
MPRDQRRERQEGAGAATEGEATAASGIGPTAARADVGIGAASRLTELSRPRLALLIAAARALRAR